MSILLFLDGLNSAINTYTETMTDAESLTITDRRIKILEFELALMYYTVINFYFRSTGVSGDENIMSQEAIQTVIDKLNNIMNTNLYTDFS